MDSGGGGADGTCMCYGGENGRGWCVLVRRRERE